MKRHVWSKEEEEFLVKNYSTKGLVYCSNSLRISKEKIRTKATKLGLKLNKKIIREILINCHIKNENEYDVNHNQFLKIETPEIAYLLGFLWADGYLSKDRYEISLNCSKEDMIEIKPIMNKIGDWNIFLHVTKQKNWKDRIKYSTSNYYLHNLLVEYDYLHKSTKSPDKLISKIPENIQHYFFLGISDGDGCFYINKKQGLYQFHITSTYEQDWKYIEDIFIKLGIDKYKINRNKGNKNANSYIRITNKQNIKKLGDYIYQNFDEDSIGLNRKYEKYKEIKKMCHKNMFKKHA